MFIAEESLTHTDISQVYTHSLYAYTEKEYMSVFSRGLSWWLSGKEFTSSKGDAGSIPGLGRSPERGHGNPLQYSCLENPNPMHREVQRVAKRG